MRILYQTEAINKPSKYGFAKDIPLIGMTFICNVVSDDGELLKTPTTTVICISVIGTDAYRVETDDCVYQIIVK